MEKIKKIPAWSLTKVKNITEVIVKARKKANTCIFASLVDLGHLKDSELESRFQKYKGRDVF